MVRLNRDSLQPSRFHLFPMRLLLCVPVVGLLPHLRVLYVEPGVLFARGDKPKKRGQAGEDGGRALARALRTSSRNEPGPRRERASEVENTSAAGTPIKPAVSAASP